MSFPCKSMINEWIPRFLAAVESAFIKDKGNNEYSSEEKIRIVKEYLAGDILLTDLTAKHGIPSIETIRKWVADYNAHKEFKDYSPKSRIHSKKSERKVDKKRAAANSPILCKP
ncbi:MAG: transposase [Clostridium sulfidigenes]|uniref:Transposase n=1 Tax=Clostridium sulfidigenes TaxID=318464 RepID=A0A927ZTB0_9CLOT|nr:transposase [Clostridium sulfidigenes]